MHKSNPSRLQAKPGEVGDMIKAGLEAGIRHIDCAWCYMNEPEVGQALAEKFAEGNIQRKDVFIAGKVNVQISRILFGTHFLLWEFHRDA